MDQIIYTKTDEAPALATQSLLPIIRFFSEPVGIQVELKDISLAGRILANFPENLKENQKVNDALEELGQLAKTPQANIIKLPNISASVPQLKAAIAELKSQGYNIPDYPEAPQTEEEEETKRRYSKILGSAVNPVLREGNSDRRVAKAVKQYAKDNPHSMGEWSANSLTHVSSMSRGDFYGSEKSLIIDKALSAKIVLRTREEKEQVLKSGLSFAAGDVIDASFMSAKELKGFLKEQIRDAKQKGVLFSIHMKATMMKVSDPIIFGHAVEAYFAPVFAKFGNELNELGVDTRYGLGDLLNKIKKRTDEKYQAIQKEIDRCFDEGPSIAMVDSERGITNLHVPSDVIIDASMPAAIRTSGKMWNREGKLQDMKAVIPDRSYASVYEKTIDFCKQHGAFDPKTMGSVSNVGLMAQKAEEYGSHDKTFEIKEAGTVRVLDDHNNLLMEHAVEAGDIWRMCQTKDEAIKDWVRLAVNRAQASSTPAIFWLDSNRSHDENLIKLVKSYLEDMDTDAVNIQILNPAEATQVTLDRVKQGKDTISVTGNVLRDYLTDLFPILELGTSAKMLSIVPLLAGGGLFETGAGGSAPKHVQQFQEENHLRWDSLGEFLALAVSLEDMAEKNGSDRISWLAEGLNQANELFLKNDKSPSRKAGELDNRGSHFYLALYWAEALAQQGGDGELKAKFSGAAQLLRKNEKQIVAELNEVQGKPVDMGGYYHPDEKKIIAVMRPSPTLNQIISGS